MPPTAKEIKYDRQLRLWSSNGQEALESARVCLVNATATGTEILKNLVLPGTPPLHAHASLAPSNVPGIGSFTIIDDKIADGEDVGVSFFLEESSIGRPRGEQACALISEMNPDVRGTFINEVPPTPVTEWLTG
jgi:amyloid beta precursor protein binding protein 1